jgi:phenol 2-monooxygenase
MQYHLNGFEPGDPDLNNSAYRFAPSGHTGPLPDEVDVLIVGTGPAGLTLAAQLAQFPTIKTAIIEQSPDRLYRGKADGIACRTMEMFEAFGFADQVMREAYWVNEVSFWKPDPQAPERIARSGRVQDVEDGLSEMPHVILNQARVHDFFLEVMRNAPAGLEPYYGRSCVAVAIDESDTSHPVTVTLERSGMSHQGQQERVKARYVVGCDGGRSTVRQAIGGTLEGDSANKAWGVMDVLVATDFPDIRRKCLIQSASEGSIVIIPREGGYLVRFYVELDDLAYGERVASRNMTSKEIIEAANRILNPYKIEPKQIAWWSIYEIGQRITQRFDNLKATQVGKKIPCVFIAGDACHTHSPKAGQGMNVSMQDTFNLGWKLAAVLEGRSAPSLLATYSEERRDIAQTLIDFDREWSTMLSTNATEIDTKKTQDYFVHHGRYTAGTATQYKPSLLTGNGLHQHLATGFVIGTRFHSVPVLRLSDVKPMHVGHFIRADGRWRILACANMENPADRGSKIHALCTYLETDPHSPIRRFTPPNADLDRVIDFRAIFPHNFLELDLESMPSLLLPKKGRFDLVDYEKIFCCDHKNEHDLYAMRGVDKDHGCIIVIRPDQYIADLFPLDDFAGLSTFFEQILLPAS